MAAGVSILLAGAFGAPAQQVPLGATGIPQFVDPLPLLSAAGGTMPAVFGNRPLTVKACEFDANVLPTGTFVPGVKPATRVWGYVVGSCPGPLDPPKDTYIGPVILNSRGTPTELTFLNELGDTSTSRMTFWKSSVDKTLHWADPDRDELIDRCVASVTPDVPAQFPCNVPFAGPIPTVAHLHGGEVPPELDGGPEGWYATNGKKGDGWYTKPGTSPLNGAVYAYPNTQESTPAWFHDHALGATRLNVYAGLAGAYLISDPKQQLAPGLHPYGLSYAAGSLDVVTIPLVVQDRMFDTQGQLYFPNSGINPEHPFWIPEFMGDTIVVNGKAWPYLNVEPKRYRFLLINGSNARTYTLTLGTDRGTDKNVVLATFAQIGTDGGYLDAPVALKSLTILPGERQEFIVDFGGFAPGTTLLLANSAKSPYPGGSPPEGSTVGRILQVRVGACASGKCGAADTSFNPALPGAWIRKAKIRRLVDAAAGALAPGVVPSVTRQLTLNEVADPRAKVGGVQYPGGPMQILLNNSMYSANTVNTGLELPVEGTTEVWEIVNTTADAHPVHLHLVQFQLMNRQAYDLKSYLTLYGASFLGGTYVPGDGPPGAYDRPNAAGALGGNPDVRPFLKGAPAPPPPQEAGWKDTIMVPPGMVTRFVVRWAPTDAPVTGATAAQLAYPFNPNSSTSKGYVWHCHIIDHEDNEMMRPSFVQPSTDPSVVRTVLRGTSF